MNMKTYSLIGLLNVLIPTEIAFVIDRIEVGTY